MNGRKVITLGCCLAVTAGGALAQLPANPLAPDPDDARENTLPAVGLLPEGSNLTGVLIPRYDTQRRLTATLRADLMTVISTQEIEALRVRIRLYEPGGGERARVVMHRALYSDATGVVRASEPVRVTTPTLEARGSGMVLEIGRPDSATNSSIQGFLLGPVSTSFYIDRRTSMNRSRPASLTSLVLACIALHGTAVAATPVPLTPAELRAIDTEVERVRTEGTAEETAAIVSRGRERARTADSRMRAFLASPATLIQNETAETTETAAPPAAETPGEKPPGVTVESEGGMYFDAEKGVIIYTKNIRLTEERFTLTCDDQLQVFLDQSNDDTAAADGKPDPAGGLLAGSGPGSGGDLQRIIATGNVRVTGKDNDGNEMTASAETAVYDAESGSFILKGGLPEIRRGPSYQRALEPGIYIRYTQDGNFEMSEGKKETFFVLPKN